VIGFLNRSGAGLSALAQTQTAMPGAPAVKGIAYCWEPASPCISSFGVDNAGNMLIILMDSASPSVEIYVKIIQAGSENTYPCQKIEFSQDTYYCTGLPVIDGSNANIRIYTKADDILLAGGELTVQFGATPAPMPTDAQAAFATPTVAEGTATPIPMTVYPNPTVYSNP
jgi:hypothetical protein